MSNRSKIKFTREDIEKMKKEGRIRGHSDFSKGTGMMQTTQGRIVAKHYNISSPAKNWLAVNLLLWCNERALQLKEEYFFLREGAKRFNPAIHSKRNFRFDWCIEALDVYIEFEGPDHQKHWTYNKDLEKYNLAAAQGWHQIRVNNVTYKSALTMLDTYYKNFTNGFIYR